MLSDEEIDKLITKVEDWQHLPETPLVTVSMTTFNHEKYIRQALESVLMQQVNFQFEILIKEDCSTDETRNILLEYQQKHPHIFRLWLTNENLYSKGVKVGLVKHCRGKYIARLEGDDYWTDHQKLQKQVDYLDAHPDVSMVYHHFNVLNPDESITSERDYIIRTLTIMHRNYPDPDNLLVYPGTIVNGDLIYRYFLKSKGAFALQSDIQPAIYRMHPGGVFSMKSTIKQIEDQIVTYDYLVNLYKDTHLESELVELLENRKTRLQKENARELKRINAQNNSANKQAPKSLIDKLLSKLQWRK
jgi:glycosyltransferase involved in cell wall biosynthesis